MATLPWPIDAPHLMGVVNLTPDSFSDGGRYTQTNLALQHIETLEKDGANSIDLGAESTRPGAIPIDAETEISRLKEVLLNSKTTLPISIDTQKAKVADWALENGASLINDVSGLRDPDMASVIANANCPVIIMHMKGTPQTMQDNPNDPSIITTILSFFTKQIDYAKSKGIEKIILDPGIGFGKTVDHNLEILANLNQFHHLGYPIMIGASNKSFIGHITGADVHDRLSGTLASHLLALKNGAQLFRVHNVKEHRQAFNVWNQAQSRLQ